MRKNEKGRNSSSKIIFIFSGNDFDAQFPSNLLL